MKKKKSFTLTAVFVALVVVLNNLLNFMLVQPGLTRVMFHELETTNPDCLVLGTSHGSYGIATDERTHAASCASYDTGTVNQCLIQYY